MENTINESLPYFVESIQGEHVSVSCMGEEYTVRLGPLGDAIQPGMFVFLQDGEVLKVIDEADAVEILSMLNADEYV